jgi:uncharacterized membrane protein
MGKYVQISVKQPTPYPARPLWKAGWVLASTYFLATLVFVGAAVLCLSSPAPAPDLAAGTQVPDTAVCVRASRYADYATARLMIGTPAREIEALIRFDRVVDGESASTLIFASMVSQSATLNCTIDGSQCTDAAILQTGANSVSRFMLASFALYGNFRDYSTTTQLGLKGEMFLRRGNEYFLTTTHFCWAPHQNLSLTTGGVAARVDAEGYLEEVGGSLGRCNGTKTRLFPLGASLETTWLALPTRYLYEHAEEDLRLRRAVVESGTVCSEKNETLSRSLIVYSAQCAKAGVCQTQPSVPYRRLAARHTVHIELPVGTEYATIKLLEASTMSRLPSLLPSEAATWISVAQLTILVLVAAVSFVRSSQKAVSPSYIILHAFRRCVGEPLELALHSQKEVIVNGLIGLLALFARFLVVSASQNLLREDNSSRVVLAEWVGCFSSLTHFLLRNAVLHTELKYETPLTKLGGPHSSVDISCAILVAFTDTPLLATKQSFSSVARLLACLLVLVSVVQTLFFSASACSMTASCVVHEIGYRQSMRGFYSVLVISTLLWVIQTICVAITLCSTFLYPFVFSLTRMTTGDTTVVRISTLMGVLCCALPTINRVTLKFARDLERRREEEDGKEH